VLVREKAIGSRYLDLVDKGESYRKHMTVIVLSRHLINTSQQVLPSPMRFVVVDSIPTWFSVDYLLVRQRHCVPG
jgi:hypothetical protein